MTQSVSPSTRPLRLYYSNEFTSVASDMCRLSAGRIELVSIDWNRFSDGWPNLFIHKADECRQYHCAFLASFHSPSVFFEQISVATALPKYGPRSFKLLTPYFSTGSMERVTKTGEVATAATLARLLSTIPCSAGGLCRITVIDIHTLANQFFFLDNVLIDLRTAIPLLLQRLKSLPEDDKIKLNVCYPDDGSYKRFHDLFVDLSPSPIVCHKVRDGEQRLVQVKEGDCAGAHVVIVDDLVQSGSTLLTCAEKLLQGGARTVSAFVTHVIFPNSSETRFLPDHTGQTLFRYFWCTDSNPVVAERVKQAGRPFEVLSLAPLLVNALLDDT